MWLRTAAAEYTGADVRIEQLSFVFFPAVDRPTDIVRLGLDALNEVDFLSI